MHAPFEYADETPARGVVKKAHPAEEPEADAGPPRAANERARMQRATARVVVPVIGARPESVDDALTELCGYSGSVWMRELHEEDAEEREVG